MFPNVFTSVLHIDAATNVITAKDFYGSFEHPYCNELRFYRDDVIYDSRGFWVHKHCLTVTSETQKMGRTALLFRTNTGVHPSGMGREDSVPNLAMPQRLVEEVKMHTLHTQPGDVSIGGASKLEVFSADAAWDSAFVLAPPTLVSAQNRLMEMIGGGGVSWSKIEDAPVDVVSIGRPSGGGGTVITEKSLAENSSETKLVESQSVGGGDLQRGSLDASSIGSATVESRFGLTKNQM